MVAGIWELGVERESSPGVYACLAAEIDGWGLWRFETANGVYFTAGKAAVGKRRPEPLGYAQALFAPAPFMHVVIRDELLAFVNGSHSHRVKAEMRVEGERFMQPVPARLDPMPLDGKRMEFVLTTMPTPRSFSKIVIDRGVIDLTGIAAIVAARAAL
jgi:hypothetical protein